eukprot:gene8069-5621_t
MYIQEKQNTLQKAHIYVETVAIEKQRGVPNLSRQKAYIRGMQRKRFMQLKAPRKKGKCCRFGERKLRLYLSSETAGKFSEELFKPIFVFLWFVLIVAAFHFHSSTK